MILSFPSGMTVKELKNIIKDWPDINEDTNEPFEVWISSCDNPNISNVVHEFANLNHTPSGSDILLS